MIKKPFIFLSKNYLKTAQYSGGAEITDIKNIFDNDKETFYQSDVLPFERTIFFVDNFGNVVNRTIDTVIFQNSNIKSFTIKAANTSGVYSDIITVTNNTDTNVFAQAATKVKTSSIKISITAINGTYLSIGELKVCNLIANLFAKTSGNFVNDTNADSFRTASGRLIHFKDYKKWSMDLDIDNLTKAQFDLLKAEIDLEEEMIILPYKDFNIEDLYECYIKPEYKYSVNRITELFTLGVKAEEL